MSLEDKAAELLRVELVRRGVTYGRLATYLKEVGVTQSERAIANKLSRGRFSFVFFLQCMAALRIDEITLDLRAPSGRGMGGRPRRSATDAASEQSSGETGSTKPRTRS